MIRLLTAVLLFASFHAVADDLKTFSDGQVIEADDFNHNFQKLEQDIADIPAGPQGEQGPAGPQGEKGDTGDQGPAGADGAAAGLNCTTDQIIKWDDANGVWVCATDPFAGLNCAVGDQLRMGSSGWECRAEPLTASLSKNSWERLNIGSISAFFDNFSNVTSASYCELRTCYIVVPGVADHTSCVVQVSGDAVGGSAFLSIATYTSDIRIIDISTWYEEAAVHISISCAP